jgi:hypothetical protein
MSTGSVVTTQGGDLVSYDVRLGLFGESDRAYTSIRHRHDFEQRATGIWADPGESIKLHATASCSKSASLHPPATFPSPRRAVAA